MATATEIAEPLPQRKYKSKKRLIPLTSGNDIPCCTDKRWFIWTRPLKAFIMRPRTWEELKKWAYINNLGGSTIRQLLAWLEMNHEADSFQMGWLAWKDSKTTTPQL
jgi:hypothetical protein